MSLHQHLRNKTRRTAARNPHPVDTMAIAIDGAALCSSQEINQLLHVIHQCHRALRQGCATPAQWGIMAGSCTMAQAIEDLGVVNGLSGHITACNEALETIRKRYETAPQTRSERLAKWGKTGLRFDEAEALKTFVEVHSFQLRQLSRSEFTQAANLAVARANSAGEVMNVVRDVQAFGQQLQAA